MERQREDGERERRIVDRDDQKGLRETKRRESEREKKGAVEMKNWKEIAEAR